ncbi:hypothetical protein F4677DRAFT_443305 [Hypoxylon crocopeplum]|nr:hypothetical protein F4677DRAFT_443305 [Hypoxylon crocopeplum]
MAVLATLACSSPVPDLELTDDWSDPSANITERQIECTTSGGLRRYTDGNPVATHLFKQVTTKVKCPGNTEHDSSTSFEIGFSADVSGAGWVTAGFSVSESWTTGEAQQFDCGHTGDKEDPPLDNGDAVFVCAWAAIGFTEYTVHECTYNSCEEPPTTCQKPYRMRAPNADGKGSSFYRSGTCYEKGHEIWAKHTHPINN